MCKESRAVLQKIFQHNVCNNNDFTVQEVSETCVQCDIILIHDTANDVFIILRRPTAIVINEAP